MFSLKSMLGLSSEPNKEGDYPPSPFALRLAVKKKTDYDNTEYPVTCTGDKCRVLMICTEEGAMKMRNGKRFATGNHPVEMLVPMLHMEKAGFSIDVVTPTGRPVKIETWALPVDDEKVMDIYDRYKGMFEDPGSFSELLQEDMKNLIRYGALFIPGGHGAMLGLPQSPELGKIIRWMSKNDKFLLSICHGPAALLSASIGQGESPFKGYSLVAFPDRLDRITPLFGYMPGKMPWFFGQRLKDEGLNIVNRNANGSCHKDRKLITGDSPEAANDFGRLATLAMLGQF